MVIGEQSDPARRTLPVESVEADLRRRISSSLWLHGCSSLVAGSVVAGVLGATFYRFLGGGGVAIGMVLFAGSWSLSTRHQRRRLRRVLEALPLEQRGQAMAALQTSTDVEVQLISRPVLRELGDYPAELAPVDMPTGRGDEPTPAG